MHDRATNVSHEDFSRRLLGGLALGVRLFAATAFVLSLSFLLLMGQEFLLLYDSWGSFQTSSQFWLSYWPGQIFRVCVMGGLVGAAVAFWARSIKVAQWIRGQGEPLEWTSRCVLLLSSVLITLELVFVLPWVVQWIAIWRYYGVAPLSSAPNPLVRVVFTLISTFGGSALAVGMLVKRRAVAKYVLQGLKLTCGKCGYPTVGLGDARVCPECGSELPA